MMTQRSRILSDLDRGRASSWIATLLLAVVTALVAACSGTEGTGESESGLAEAGRWSIPADVKTVGARVRLTYDAAPRWSGPAACGGKLLVGSKKLGQHLMASFDGIESIGGYACRRNTADGSRMSVHGTGRALDVMIPRIGGKADNTRGDKIANWLVLNSQRIGVQLIIWDRTVWRANGTNDAQYGGPHPHDDHLHVELTDEGGAATTPWFSDMTTTTAEAGAGDAARDADSAPRADAGPDAGPDAAKDSEATTVDSGPAPATDAGSTEPEDPKSEDPKGDGTTPPSSGDPPSSGYEIPENEEETERDSIGNASSKRPIPSSEDEETESSASSCSATSHGSRAPAGMAAGGVVFALGMLVRRRRR